MRTALLKTLFIMSLLALCGFTLAACEDDAGSDCEVGTECPGGGCRDGICVTICDDPCAGRDDLVCIIDHEDKQMCVSTDGVDVDRNFVPVSGDPGGSSTGTETDTGSTAEEDAGADVAAGG